MSNATDTQEFLDAIDAFAQAVRRARGVPAVAGDGVLTLSQYALIQGLTERAGAHVAELATDAGVTPPTATRILDVLERRGVVRRTRAPEDRRSVLVSLTDSGRELLETRHEWQRARELSFYADLPETERELAPDLLLRLAGLIDELAAGPEAGA